MRSLPEFRADSFPYYYHYYYGLWMDYGYTVIIIIADEFLKQELFIYFRMPRNEGS
jgi:hypothetical protein